MRRLFCSVLLVCFVFWCFAASFSAVGLSGAVVVDELIGGGEYLPAGHLYLQPVTGGMGGDSEILIYSYLNASYFKVRFKGTCSMVVVEDTYVYSFSDPESLSVREYECTGRNLYDLKTYEEGRSNVQLSSAGYNYFKYYTNSYPPGGILDYGVGVLAGWYVMPSKYGDVYVQVVTRHAIMNGQVTYDIFTWGYGYTVTNPLNQVINVTPQEVAAHLQMAGYYVPVELGGQEVGSTYYDYRVVQKDGSPVSSMIDSQFKYSFSTYYRDNVLNISGDRLYGSPLVYYQANSSVPLSVYTAGYGVASELICSYVRKWVGGRWVLEISDDSKLDLMPASTRLSWLNQALAHFGYPVIDASNLVTKDDVNAMDDMVGGAREQIEQGKGAVGELDGYQQSIIDAFQSGGSHEIRFPAFSLPMGDGTSIPVWNEYIFDFDILDDNFGLLMTAVRTGTVIVVYVALIRYLQHAYERIFEGRRRGDET